jgi:hypothetical protein
MNTTKRATVYLDANLHRALRLKAAETDTSISELVNTAVRKTLAEDAEDLASFRERADEPTLAFEELVQDLKRRGKL